MTCWLCGFETTELATNAKPPIDMCKNEPCQICVAVAKVDNEIGQAVDALRALIAKRCDLRSEHNRAHGLVHRLPVELKDHIFELLLPSRDEWGEISPTETTVMPSYLASVCRGWRDIAWSNPFLWSTMHIALGTSNSTSDPFNIAQDWFLRSRTLPLTFHIKVVDLGVEGSERSMQVLPLVLDAMSQGSNRIQSLSLDIPLPILCAFQHSNFQWHRLKRLRIISSSRWQNQFIQPLPFLNPTASPETIELHYICLHSLQVSWNRLSSAKVRGVDLEDVTQLFQHASQMTDCHIASLALRPENFTFPPIIHHRLKTLSLRSAQGWHASMLLDSLTLPCLQEFCTFEMVLLIHLPALMHRSSCPLTMLTLCPDYYDDLVLFEELHPLPGVTDLVVESLGTRHQAVKIKRLLLEKYFPDLQHLTLRQKPFLFLWEMGAISLLLDCKRHGLDEGRLLKILVVYEDQAPEFDPVLWEKWKALGIILREDGFEFI